MSSEIVEATFRNSHLYRREIMLIASKNQIDYSGGYVNNWTTKDFMDFIKQMRGKYPNSNVIICRDHCGPGFNNIYSLDNTYKTIEEDIKNGFDLIHIDFCLLNSTREDRLAEIKKAILYCLGLNPGILLEIGTDENVGSNFGVNTLAEIEREVDFFKGFCNPEFYVIQTGSLVKEIGQVGNFNKSFIEKVSKMLKSKNIKLKEHNSDYLSKDEIFLRKGCVDAMNIAPQLGVIQTMHVLKKCLVYGINFDRFLEESYNGKKWVKWLYNNNPSNKLLCTIISGHYHFASDSYKDIIKKLEQREDIHENIINDIMEVINHYEY